jgi:multimeric flavodoxin WrbA
MDKPNRLKILAIYGSPRKGGTFSILNELKNYFKGIDIDIVMLKDLDLKDCLGCYQCISKGEELCPLKDDRDKIIKLMKEADGVIFASPTYVNHITSLMKKFIERTGFLGHRPEFFDKYAMVIGTCKGFGADKVTKYLKEIFTTYGFNVASSLELKISTKSEREQQYNKELSVTEFKKFIKKVNDQEKPTPTIYQVVMFKILKYVAEKIQNTFRLTTSILKIKATITTKRRFLYLQDSLRSKNYENSNKILSRIGNPSAVFD